jgi:hypothetical protein
LHTKLFFSDIFVELSTVDIFVAVATFVVFGCVVWYWLGNEHKSVISTYQRCLVESRIFPENQYGNASHRGDGDAKKLFSHYLYSNKDLDIPFLKEVGLLHSKVTLTIVVVV